MGTDLCVQRQRQQEVIKCFLSDVLLNILVVSTWLHLRWLMEKLYEKVNKSKPVFKA